MSDYEAMKNLTGVTDPSLSAADQMKAAYDKFREIVGAPAAGADDLVECENCHEMYKEKDNTDDSCMWDARNHKGLYLTDYESDFWYGWHEANPPKKSAYWKKNHGGEGGHKWTGCGCTSHLDECERIGRHKPLDSPASDDDWEEEESRDLSDDEFDAKRSEKYGQEMLVSNYKASLGYRIKHLQEKGK